MKIRMNVPAALFAVSMFAGSALADGTIRFDSIGDGYRHWGGIFNFTQVSDSPTHGGDLGGGYSTGQWAGIRSRAASAPRSPRSVSRRPRISATSVGTSALR